MSPDIRRILLVAAVSLCPMIVSVGAAASPPLQLAMNGNTVGKMPQASGTTPSGLKHIQILAPANGAEIGAGVPVVLSYDVTLAPNGNHIHFYVDNHMAGLSHELKGTFSLGTLAPGTHDICIKEATVAHVLIGVNRCILVTVK